MKWSVPGLVGTCTGVVLVLAAGQAHAQFGKPGRVGPGTYSSRPTVSPLINLRGSNAAFNYYGIVRPEQELRTLTNRQRQSITALEQRVQEDEAKTEYSLPKTGHGAYFGNYSHFYRLAPAQPR